MLLGELEAEVDHAGAVLDGEAHAFGDRRCFAFSLAVEHPDGHDASAERQAGEAVVVARGLGDRPGDERPVAVAVVGKGVVCHEVIALDEPVAAEVGRAAIGTPVGVGDAGIEHRDDHVQSAGGMIGGHVCPCFGRVDAERAGEVPLQLPPVTRRAAGARIVGDRGIGGVGEIVGYGPEDVAATAQTMKRGRDAHAGRKVEQPRVGGGRDSLPSTCRSRHRPRHHRSGRGGIPDDYLVGNIGTLRDPTRRAHAGGGDAERRDRPARGERRSAGRSEPGA